MTTLNKGLVHIYTGDGKGKTSAALGLSIRALGAGYKVCLIQFLKGYASCSEERLLKKLAKKIKVVRFKEMHPNFFSGKKRKSAKAILKRQILNDFQKAKDVILSKKYDVVIMDEMINIVNQNFMPEYMLIKLIDAKPKGVELILTGRGASKRLIKKADYATEMRLVRHPFYKGLKARKGIEF